METRRDHMLIPAPDKTEMNRIMLNFRPIAPKPPSSVADSATSGSLLDRPPFSSSRLRRSKRKYVRTNWNKNRSKGIASSRYQEKNLVTLQLLPEKDHSDGSEIDLNRTVSSKGSHEGIVLPEKSREPSDLRSARIVKVESWMTVESVTGACKVGVGLRVTDEDRLRSLEWDTYPAMVSDGEDRVVWVNEAYKRMLMSQAGNDWVVPEITVWLVIKPGVAVQRIWAEFSCSVRVRAWQEAKCLEWGAAPCDAWRMDGGGFAWRFDVEAALSLGRVDTTGNSITR